MMSVSVCPCGSGNLLDACCGHYHAGTPAPDAQTLMRSRYSAYVLGLVDYLVATTLPAQQAQLDRAGMAAWSAQSTWLGLEVESAQVLGGNYADLMSPLIVAGVMYLVMTLSIAYLARHLERRLAESD